MKDKKKKPEQFNNDFCPLQVIVPSLCSPYYVQDLVHEYSEAKFKYTWNFFLILAVFYTFFLHIACFFPKEFDNCSAKTSFSDVSKEP